MTARAHLTFAPAIAILLNGCQDPGVLLVNILSYNKNIESITVKVDHAEPPEKKFSVTPGACEQKVSFSIAGAPKQTGYVREEAIGNTENSLATGEGYFTLATEDSKALKIKLTSCSGGTCSSGPNAEQDSCSQSEMQPGI